MRQRLCNHQTLSRATSDFVSPLEDPILGKDYVPTKPLLIFFPRL